MADVSDVVDVVDVAPVARASKAAALAIGGFESPTFERDIGSALRHARRRRRIRLRHLADARLSARTLKAAERGELPLTRALVTELASRYGLDLGALFPPKQRLTIAAHGLVMGLAEEPCDATSLTSVLQAYLLLIDRVRTDVTGKTRPLRRDDIRVLADHLDLPCTTVIARLADLLEARGSETRAMIDLYLTGASVVGLHEGTALEDVAPVRRACPVEVGLMG